MSVEEIDNDTAIDTFGEDFGILAGSKATQEEDATATLDDSSSLVNQQVEEPLDAPVDELPEEDPVANGDDQEGEPEDWEGKYKALETKYESLDKQKRDNQSFNDQRFAEIEKRLAANAVPVPEEVPEKELTKEELSDLQYDDPDAYFDYMVDKRAAKQQAANPQPTQQDINSQVQFGVERSLHSDFDEMFKVADEAAKLNPALVQECLQAENPARAAYELGQRISEAKGQTIDPAAYKEKIRQEILAEMEGATPNQNSKKTLHKVPSARTPRKSKNRPQANEFGFGTLAGSGALK